MYGIMINSKECAAEDKPGYFIYLSQQKEKGIHMNTFYSQYRIWTEKSFSRSSSI